MSELSDSERDRRYYDLLNTKRRRDGLPPVVPGAGRASYSPHGPRAMAVTPTPEKVDVTLDAIPPAVMAQIETAAAKLDPAAKWAEDPAPVLSTPEARAEKIASMLFGERKPKDEIRAEVAAVAGEDVSYNPPEWYQPPVLESDR